MPNYKSGYMPEDQFDPDEAEVENFWDERLKRRAFADGRASRGTGAVNPYVDQPAKASWDEGFNSTDQK